MCLDGLEVGRDSARIWQLGFGGEEGIQVYYPRKRNLGFGFWRQIGCFPDEGRTEGHPRVKEGGIDDDVIMGRNHTLPQWGGALLLEPKHGARRPHFEVHQEGEPAERPGHPARICVQGAPRGGHSGRPCGI